jgi:hypothetical protein
VTQLLACTSVEELNSGDVRAAPRPETGFTKTPLSEQRAARRMEDDHGTEEELKMLSTGGIDIVVAAAGT